MPGSDLPSLMDQTLSCASGAEWADWLEANQRASDGVWLALPKKGTAVASIGRPEAVEIALCYGWIDGKAASSSMPDGWWAQRFTPRRARSVWSKINRTLAESLIASGRMRPAGLEQIRLAQADGRWAAAYDPQSTAQVPSDLQEALDALPASAAAFRTLDARDRYQILLAIQTATKPEARARRIADHVARLAARETPGRS
jgi:uncharacterized protein YdeI (YjbR/CyaY-like superfamily)